MFPYVTGFDFKQSRRIPDNKLAYRFHVTDKTGSAQ